MPEYPTLTHPGDRSALIAGLSVAVLLHLLLMLVVLPDAKSPIPPRSPRPQPPNIVRPVLTPPRIERPTVERERPRRKLPLPDPEPERPEPVGESAPPVEIETSTSDLEVAFLLPDAVHPPAPGPKIPGGDVLPPVLIAETKIPPVYPELARVARLEGRVILKAVIHADGTVGEVEVLRCDEPGIGLEQASIDAVRRWMYEPATQRGTPVDVYFTIQVIFTLQ